MTIHKGAMQWLTAASVATVAAIVLSACGGSPSTTGGGSHSSELVEPTKPITITYAGAAYSADDIKPVIDAFEKAHPNITVKYESVPFDDFNSVLAARLTNANNAIDVFDVDMPRTSAYVARGWLADITSTFPYIAKSVDPGSLSAATVDKKLVAMPYQTSTNIMYYNADLLKAAGVPLPSADPAKRLSWETVTDEAKQAQSAGGAQYGLLFDQIDRYYQLEPLAISAGGGPGASGAKNLTPEITNAGWTKAFEWYGKLFADKISPRGVTAAETPDIFAAGKTAFYVGGPWWAGKFDEAKFNFGVTAFPVFDGGEASTPTGGWSLGLNPKASTDKSNAARIFMKFMGLDSGGYAQYLSALAVPPSNLEGGVKFYESDAFKDPRMAGIVDLMKSELANTSTLRLQTVGYVEFEDIMTKAFSDIINGTDASKALESAKSDLTDAWSKFK